MKNADKKDSYVILYWQEGYEKQMVIDIRVRKCLNIHYDNMYLENIIRMMWKSNVPYDLLCVYKDNEYYANIDINMLWTLASDDELYEYINNKSVHGWVEGFDINRAEELFFIYKDAGTIPLEKPNESSNEVFAVCNVQLCNPANYVDFTTYRKFIQKGITSYIINIPSEMKSVYGPYCTKIALVERWLKAVKDPKLKKVIENDIKRISDLSYDEYVCQVSDSFYDRAEEKKMGEGAERTIYLIGPCIVGGCSPSKKYVAQILNELLEQCDLPYKIIKVMGNFFPNEIMEYNICRKDIVIYIGTDLDCKDYDLAEEYEEYDGIKNLCTNITMHASQAGCELIANSILNYIIIPHNQNINTLKNNPILHYAEPDQLKLDTEYEVKMYLKRLSISQSMRRGNNGAIVMNANPFTLGHRKLIEYALSQVDQLFVFVVEENASFFSFKERLEMVRQGTEGMENITVIGSGSFIISNKTFYDYFTKEIDNGKVVDASKDIFIFARYVVPYLNIKKRFVGEEPVDKITAQYNEQMKEILPDYGCELIEIPRFQENNIVISGSMVRRALRDKDLDFLKNMLPSSSFQYIYEHLDLLRNRQCQIVKREYSVCMTDRLQKVKELIETLKQKRTVIIYGIGNDTTNLLKLLQSREKDNIIFVDKKAEKSTVQFMGKEVLAPFELKDNYLECDIVILSTKYYREIYFECIGMGVDKRRIKYNPYNLAVEFSMEI